MADTTQTSQTSLLTGPGPAGEAEAPVAGSSGASVTVAPATPAPSAAGQQAAPEAPAEKAQSQEKRDAAEAPKTPPPDIEVKLPEGVVADESVLQSFKATAKELGLKQESAQLLVDLYVKSQAIGLERRQQVQAEQVQKWAEAVKADKDIGGAKLQESLVAARRAVQFAGGDALRQVLNETGLGNHPVFVRAFAAVGRALSEDSIAGQTAPATQHAPTEKDMLKMFYPSMYEGEK